MNRGAQQMASISLFAMRRRSAKPLAGLMVLLFLFVFVASTWHEHLEPAPDGSPRIAFHSLGVPEPREVDPRTAGLPEVSVPLEEQCPLCLWQVAGKTVPVDSGVRVPAVAPAPERPAELHIDNHTGVLLISLGCRAPPSSVA